ncbi:hypothetical protein D3C72_1916900 [compost metagenome]
MCRPPRAASRILVSRYSVSALRFGSPVISSVFASLSSFCSAARCSVMSCRSVTVLITFPPSSASARTRCSTVRKLPSV